MKKSLLIKSILVISCIYLVVQFIVIPVLFGKKDTYGLTPLKIYKNLFYQFVYTYQSSNIPLFLLDIEALQKSKSPEDLFHRLADKEYLTFGLKVTDEITSHRKRFTALGFKIIQIPITPGNQNVSGHYYIYTSTMMVHIVMFHERTPNTVWHSAVLPTDLPHYLTDVDKQMFAHHAGIFDKFDVIQYGTFMIPPPEFIAAEPSSHFLPCDEHRAQQFLVKYPQDQSKDAKKFQRKARQIISRAKQYLDDLNIPFWLSSGTCLGWYRQCDIITYSKDVDLGIYNKDFKPEIIPVFETGGFFLKHVFGKVSDSYELSFQAGDIKLDLFFFYEEPDIMWNGGTHHLTGQKYKYSFPKFRMCWTVFLELKVRVPCPPEPYIEANYGKNWLEPVQHWEWNKSPPNVKENGVWPKEEWDEVIQVY